MALNDPIYCSILEFSGEDVVTCTDPSLLPLASMGIRDRKSFMFCFVRVSSDTSARTMNYESEARGTTMKGSLFWQNKLVLCHCLGTWIPCAACILHSQRWTRAPLFGYCGMFMSEYAVLRLRLDADICQASLVQKGRKPNALNTISNICDQPFVTVWCFFNANLTSSQLIIQCRFSLKERSFQCWISQCTRILLANKHEPPEMQLVCVCLSSFNSYLA